MIKKVAIQGEKASFHDIAAAKIFGPDSSRVFCDSFPKTFKTLANGESDYALCAIENSLFGSINEVYDLLLSSKKKIIAEICLRIDQCLIGLPSTELKNVKKVYSHPVALAQCERYLSTELSQAEREEYEDTAAAVALVKKEYNPEIVAIASKEAAELYGLKVLAESIETNKENYTRFVALGNERFPKSKPNKTSLVLEVCDSAGSLHGVLGEFAKRSINLTKLQSRPLVGRAWHYLFYVDIEIGDDDPLYIEVLEALHSLNCKVTQLGSYEAQTRIVYSRE